MNAAEKRQTRRIIRNARKAEYGLFEAIELVQEQLRAPAEACDWQATRLMFARIGHHLQVCEDLAANAQDAAAWKGVKP